MGIGRHGLQSKRRIIIAVFNGITYWINGLINVSNPADVIKVRVQAVATETNVSTIGVIRSLVNEGARALFNGLGTKLMTITPKLVF